MTAAVVIPVRDGSSLVRGCLDTVMPQAATLGARVVVVDDASTDGTAAEARRAGADVIVLDRQGGPYAARNCGWRAVSADEVVFTDVRCRARPGWLAALLDTLQQPGVALTGGDVVIEPGCTLAQRAAHLEQPLLARQGCEGEFLPWFPACNLATHDTVLKRLGGFRARRGGGDVDLCWRAQLTSCGEARTASGATMDWHGRERVLELLAQFHRYGVNMDQLYAEHAAEGITQPILPPLHRDLVGETRFLAGCVFRQPVGQWAPSALSSACRILLRQTYRHRLQARHQ